MQVTEPPFVVERSFGKARSLITLTGGFSAFLVVNAFIAMSVFDGILQTLAIALMAIGAAFFAYLAANLAYRLVTSHPLLVVDAEGFVDDASLGSVGRIPWSDVETMSLEHFGGSLFIGVAVSNLDAVVRRQRGWLKRKFLLRRIQRGWGVVAIPADLLPDEPAEILDRLQAARRRWLADHAGT
jgi:hypothetical protein